MGRILYIPHIPWKWAKQRPQFIAEELSKTDCVNVVLRKEYKKAYRGEVRSSSKVSFHSIFRFPCSRIKIIDDINRLIFKREIKKIIRDYDIIWVSSPEQYSQIAALLMDNQILVYDCMDDMLEFPEAKKDKSFAEKLCVDEQKLIMRADVVFCSSFNLSNIIQKRYVINENKIHIVNNALSDELLQRKFTNSVTAKDISSDKHITYIGTIDKWFDYDLIENISSKYKNVIFDLYGPVIYKPSKTSLNVVFHGVVPHEEIANIMNASDMLVMPFKVTPLIESVNPVKLYEYILSGKPTVAVRYGETERFSKFVYLYGSEETFENYVKLLLNRSLEPLNTMENVRTFCASNTWCERVKEMKSILDEIASTKEEGYK